MMKRDLHHEYGSAWFYITILMWAFSVNPFICLEWGYLVLHSSFVITCGSDGILIEESV